MFHGIADYFWRAPGATPQVQPRGEERLEAFGSGISYCEQRIAEEDAAAAAASSPEAASVHEQLAMLYRSQLAALQVRYNRDVPGAA